MEGPKAIRCSMLDAVLASSGLLCTKRKRIEIEMPSTCRVYFLTDEVYKRLPSNDNSVEKHFDFEYSSISSVFT